MKNHFIAGLAGVLLLGTGCNQLPDQKAMNMAVSARGTIRIVPTQAARTVQARMTDIDHVLFTLESADRAFNALAPIAVATQSLAFVNGAPATDSVTFGNLWPGVATVSATIYGVNPIRTQAIHTQALLETLGTTSTTATVVSNQTTPVPLNIKMVDTQTQAGSLNFDLGIEEGNEVLVPYNP
ncbi:MAG: hypothetical protein ACM3YO_06720 [Bacteroidota bacterium]